MSTLWRRMLHRWAGSLPTVIYDAEISEADRRWAPLFERGHVFTVRLPLVGEVTCYLHHYLRSDPDRGMHDHPWPWAIALPLAGGYDEDRFDGLALGQMVTRRRWRSPFVPYRLTGTDYHRVVIAETGRTAWSLFFTGQNDFKPWGFLRPYLGADGVPGLYYVVHKSRSSTSTWWTTGPLGKSLDRAEP